MAKKTNTPQTEEELVAAALAVAEGGIQKEKLSEIPTDNKQPMSLEDALFAAEQAASELVVEEAPRKKKNNKTAEEPVEDLPDLSVASFDPTLVSDDDLPLAAVEPVAEENTVPEPEPVMDIPIMDIPKIEIPTDEILAEETPVEVAEEIPEVIIPEVEIPVEEIPSVVNSLADEGIASAELAIAAVEAEQAESAPLESPEDTTLPVETAEAPEQAKEDAPAETTPEVKPAAKKPAAKKSSTPKPKKEVAAVVPEPVIETIAEVVEEAKAETAEALAAQKPKKSSKKSKESSKKEEEKPALTPEEEAQKEEKQVVKKKKLKKKLDPDQNFKLLKTLILILSGLLTAVSGHFYYSYVYIPGSAFSVTKLVPLIPFFAQLLLVLISMITVGTSKRKPIGATIKANALEAKEIKANKEFEDNLLVPEVDLTTKRTTELSSYQIDNFYKKNIEEINGKFYMQIAKFDDSVRAFEAMGATDMELCAVNMVGNAKFTEILDQPRAKTLNSSDLISYFLSKPHTFAIKKRGAIDWTFKYDSKSFGIIRESDDSYKVSIKCYPDAATKLNDTYKALEDSNFPSGPLWYCFNELRNLPPRVCKWLVDTSCQISKFQQIKTDKLKDDKAPKDYDIDLAGIAAKFKAGEKVINLPKYSLVFTKGTDADLTTFLSREIEGLDASGYTKEYYYKFSSSDDAVSICCPTKGVNEDVIITLIDHIESVLK